MLRLFLAAPLVVVFLADDKAPPPKPTATLGDGKTVVNGVAFSPDGKRLAAVGAEGIRLWDVATGKEVRTLAPTAEVLAVAFSADGKLLATGGKGGTVQVWDVATGAEKHRFENVGDWVRAVAFSPDGTRLAFAVGRKVGLLDLSGPAPKRLQSGYHRDHVNGVAFSPDGKRLVSAGRDDDSFRLWDVTAEGLSQKRVLLQSSTEAWSAAFSPDGKQVVLGNGFEVLLLDTTAENGRPVTLGRHGGGNADVRSVAVSTAGLAASAAVSDGYRVWDVATRKQVALLPEPGAFTVAFSPDGKRLATAGGKGVVKVWDVAKLGE